jgi:hypothetical protein
VRILASPLSLLRPTILAPSGIAHLIDQHPARLWLLFLLLSLPWFCSVPGVYLFDDYITPLNDPASQGVRAFWHQLGTTIRPLTKLTYGLEAELGLDGVDIRRMVQILVHTGNAVLFSCLVRKICTGQAVNGLAVLLAGAVYLLHPIQAEKVLAIAGRSALLMEGLLLAAVLAALNRRCVASLFLFIASILARETAVCFLPLLVVLFGPARRRERWLLCALALLALCLLLAIPQYQSLAAFSFTGRDWGLSCIRQVSAIPVGLSLYFTPWRLSIDHGEQLASHCTDPLFLAGVAIIGLLAFLLTLSRMPVRCGALWMLAALLPTQSCIPKIDALTERPFALALAGLLILAVAACTGSAARKSRPLSVVVLLMALAVAAIATGQRALLYGDELAIWLDAMQKSTTNIRPHLNAATLLIEEGRIVEAQAVLLQADAINPFDADLVAKLRQIHYKNLLKESTQ